MAYIPSLADIQELHSAPIDKSTGYTPSLSDISANNPPVQSQQSSGFSIPNLLKSYGNYQLNTILGAGDAIQNTLADVANLIPGIHAPMAHTGSGPGYGVGRFIGNTGAFVGGGELADLARAASEGAPIIGELSQKLGGDGLAGVMRRALGTAGYGAITNPDNRGQGALEGAALSGAVDALPGAAKLINKGINTFAPNKYLGQVVNSLGSGNSLENNAQSLAQDLQSAYQQRTGEGNELYNRVFNNIPSGSLYNNALNQSVQRVPVANNFKNLDDIIDYVNDSANQKLESPAELKEYLANNYGYKFNKNSDLLSFFNSAPQLVNTGKYASLDPSIISGYDRNLTNLHQQFINNPTFQNAHNLQSQLGSAIRKMQTADNKGNLSVADRSTMQGYQEAQGALRNDMNDYLNSVNPALKDQYVTATNYWANNVSPYFENPAISQIAKGEILNPRNIANIFKNPEPETQQIVADMGPQAANKIIYSELGKPNNTASPDKFMNAVANLDKQGLSSYVTPNLSEQLDTLSQKMKNQKIAQSAVGLLAGAALAHPFGHLLAPTVLEGAGALGGAVFGPKVIKALETKLPINQIGTSIANGTKAAYSPISRAILANIISQGAQ